MSDPIQARRDDQKRREEAADKKRENKVMEAASSEKPPGLGIAEGIAEKSVEETIFLALKANGDYAPGYLVLAGAKMMAKAEQKSAAKMAHATWALVVVTAFLFFATLVPKQARSIMSI